MIETNTKTQRQVEFLREHTLTASEKRKLIEEKLDRAAAYHEAVKKREAVCGRR